MASGKTSLGRALAAALARPFVANDDQLLTMTGSTARELEAARGRDELHEVELAALEQALATEEPCVVAAAASTIDTDAGRAAIIARAHVAWIDAPAAVLATRVGPPAGLRPTGTDVDSLTAQRDQRSGKLESVAELVVSSDQAFEHSLEQLVRWARQL